MTNLTTVTKADLEALYRKEKLEYGRNYKSVRITKTTNRVLNELAYALGICKTTLLGRLIERAIYNKYLLVNHYFKATKRRPKFDLSTTMRVRKDDYEKVRDIADSKNLPIGIVIEALLTAYGQFIPGSQYHDDLLDLLGAELTSPEKGE